MPLLPEWAASPVFGGNPGGIDDRFVLCITDCDGVEGWGEAVRSGSRSSNEETLSGLVARPGSGRLLDAAHHAARCVERELRNNYVGASSLALQVEDAVSEYERLTSAGVLAVTAPTEIVRDGKVAAVAFYILDPDAIPIEIWQPVDA